MSPALAALPSTLGSFSLTKHAYERMTTRSISRTAIEAALEFGRCVEIRGAHPDTGAPVTERLSP